MVDFRPFDFVFSLIFRTFAPMKIRSTCKVREMAGEHIIVLPGSYGADMTRVISLNASSLMLWEALAGADFEVADVAQLLLEHYDVDAATAERDAAAWVLRLRESGLLEE